ncbi:unnamed protein product [Parnassius apollo]|uniref:(apollo) hypothetical protein n=1 Tax=Parnassius apollo TaxID=110799 RepID=A0A8S3XAQ9_PARAO|nr:unnamed protein product [Parnassius apollo]
MEISCAAHRVQSGNVQHISEKYFRSAVKIWFQNAFSLYGGLIRLNMEAATAVCRPLTCPQLIEQLS